MHEKWFLLSFLKFLFDTNESMADINFLTISIFFIRCQGSAEENKSNFLILTIDC